MTWMLSWLPGTTALSLPQLQAAFPSTWQQAYILSTHAGSTGPFCCHPSSHARSGMLTQKLCAEMDFSLPCAVAEAGLPHRQAVGAHNCGTDPQLYSAVGSLLEGMLDRAGP